jgi:hypothetical protein
MEAIDQCWRKSSYSANGGECVETASNRTGVHVRDTKHRDGAELKFSAATWRKFIASVKR